MGSLRKNWRDFRKELEKFVEKHCNKIPPLQTALGGGRRGVFLCGEGGFTPLLRHGRGMGRS